MHVQIIHGSNDVCVNVFMILIDVDPESFSSFTSKSTSSKYKIRKYTWSLYSFCGS